MRIIKEYKDFILNIKTEDKVRQKRGINHFPELLTTVFGEDVAVAFLFGSGCILNVYQSVGVQGQVECSLDL